jgi:hypothetical protein
LFCCGFVSVDCRGFALAIFEGGEQAAFGSPRKSFLTARWEHGGPIRFDVHGGPWRHLSNPFRNPSKLGKHNIKGIDWLSNMHGMEKIED